MTNKLYGGMTLDECKLSPRQCGVETVKDLVDEIAEIQKKIIMLEAHCVRQSETILDLEYFESVY